MTLLSCNVPVLLFLSRGRRWLFKPALGDGEPWHTAPCTFLPPLPVVTLASPGGPGSQPARHPAPARARRRLGTARVVPGLPGPQPEDLAVQAPAVPACQRSAFHCAAQVGLPAGELRYVPVLTAKPAKGEPGPELERKTYYPQEGHLKWFCP